MRTLSSELTTAQVDDSRTPYLTITFTSFDGATVRTYTTADGTNRIILAKQAEGRFDEDNREVLGINDTDMPISTIIQIHDDDKSINVLDHKGYKVQIGWGFNTTAGDQSSKSPAMIVVEQRSLSFEGTLVVEFYCMSLFDFTRFGWAKQTVTLNIEYHADVTVRHLLMDLLGRQPDAVLVEDNSGGTYEDMTAEAIDPTDGSDLGSANDLFIMPSGATEAADDSFIVGAAEVFDIFSINLTTLGVQGGATVLAFEYVTATGPDVWSTLSSVVDNTTEWTTGELVTIRWQLPTNWVTTTINSQGPFYYMRVRIVSLAANYSTNPLATKLVINSRHAGITLDTATADQGDDYKPSVSFRIHEDLIFILKQILGETLLVLYVADDGFHLKFKDASVGSVDYTYKTVESSPTTDHGFFTGMLREQLIVPNSIIYTNLAPGEDGTRIQNTSGTPSQDSTSVAAYGVIQDVRVEPDLVTSAAVATTLSDGAIKRLLRDAVQATIEVPMNCGQEVWDVVTVNDTRSGQVFTTILSQLLRTYEPGFYSLEMFSGGAINSSGNLVSPTKGLAPSPEPPPEPPPPVPDPPPPVGTPPPVAPAPLSPSAPTRRRERPLHDIDIPDERTPQEVGVTPEVDPGDVITVDPRRFRGDPSTDPDNPDDFNIFRFVAERNQELNDLAELRRRQQALIAGAEPFINPEDIGGTEPGLSDQRRRVEIEATIRGATQRERSLLEAPTTSVDPGALGTEPAGPRRRENTETRPRSQLQSNIEELQRDRNISRNRARAIARRRRRSERRRRRRA